MSEPPRDPLAEHPIAPDMARRRPGARATLELFPAVSEAPLGLPGDAARRPDAPALAPLAPPASAAASVPEAIPREPPAAAQASRQTEILADAEEPRSVAFARRVAAGLADLLILALVGAVELAAGALLLDLRFPPPAFVPLAAFLLLAALVLLVLAPFVWGTTPGMALADLRIRAEDGGSPTLAAAFLRFVGFLLTGALAGVPLLVAAFDRRGRTLADLVSRTTIEPVEATDAKEPGLA
ncbi:MAG: RDD family protein [Thermoanaerobaculia bacterium]|nr:RDD family protein [Thermoanaerobaculia bacterium]